MRHTSIASIATLIAVTAFTLACRDTAYHAAVSTSAPFAEGPTTARDPSTPSLDGASPSRAGEAAPGDVFVDTVAPLTSTLVADGDARLIGMSEDGHGILYLTPKDGLYHLYNVPTRAGVALTDLPEQVGDLVLSRDGTHLLYRDLDPALGWPSSDNLYLADWDTATGAVTTTLVDVGIEKNTQVFSFDGQHIAYRHVRTNHVRYRFYHVESDSYDASEPRTMSDHTKLSLFPSVGGAQVVAFVVDEWVHDGDNRYHSEADIRLRDLNTGDDRLLGIDLDFDARMRFDPSGERLGYLTRAWGPQEGAYQIHDLKQNTTWSTEPHALQPVTTPALDAVAYKRLESGEIVLQEVGAEPLAVLDEDAGGATLVLGFTPSGRYLIVARWTSYGVGLFFAYDRAANTMAAVVPVEAEVGGGSYRDVVPAVGSRLKEALEASLEARLPAQRALFERLVSTHEAGSDTHIAIKTDTDDVACNPRALVIRLETGALVSEVEADGCDELALSPDGLELVYRDDAPDMAAVRGLDLASNASWIPMNMASDGAHGDSRAFPRGDHMAFVVYEGEGEERRASLQAYNMRTQIAETFEDDPAWRLESWIFGPVVVATNRKQGDNYELWIHPMP